MVLSIVLATPDTALGSRLALTAPLRRRRTLCIATLFVHRDTTTLLSLFSSSERSGINSGVNELLSLWGISMAILFIGADSAPGHELPCEPVRLLFVPDLSLLGVQFRRDATLVRRLCLRVISASLFSRLLLLASLTRLLLTCLNRGLSVFDVISELIRDCELAMVLPLPLVILLVTGPIVLAITTALP